MLKLGPRIRGFPAIIVAILWLIVPATALAAGGGGLGSGVHTDPGSPAGKEYAIPLDSARGGGGGGSSSSGSGSSSTGASRSAGSSSSGSDLFGAGITKADTASSTTHTTAPGKTGTTPHKTHKARHHRRGATHATGHHSIQGAAPAGSQPPPPQNVIGTNAGSSTGITWMLGAAVLVVLLGALGGAVLSRRGRRTDPYPG